MHDFKLDSDRGPVIPQITVLYCSILGGIALGQGAPNIQYFVAGRAAGSRLFAVLRRQPLIADQPGTLRCTQRGWNCSARESMCPTAPTTLDRGSSSALVN